MPSFCQAAFLEDAIRSVIGQNYPNTEFFVIDGGSTDGSVEIIRRYEPYITRWVSEKDEGQSDAINKGLQWATGDIITWLNSDDLLLPGALHTVAALFKRHSDAWLIHGKTQLFGKGFPVREKGAPVPCPEALYLGKLPFPQPSAFFRKEALQAVGLTDPSLHYGMDYDLFLRMYLQNGHFVAVDNLLSGYRLHRQAKSIALQALFARDYARIFARLLNSLAPDKALSDMAERAGLPLSEEKNNRYEVRRNIGTETLRQALFENAFARLSFLYEALSLPEARRVAEFLQAEAPEFCAAHPEIVQIAARSRLPSSLIRLLRRLR